MIDDYADLRVTVMGLGRFGGGVGVTRFLAERGADVLVTDTLAPEELKDSVAQLADLEAKGAVNYRLGEHNVSDFTTCDLLVVNPAVKPGNRFVRAARAAGVPITSEIRLLVKHLPNRLRTIGVTGSAGKSTTTAMIAHILRKVLGQEGETPLVDGGELTPRRQDAKTPRRTVGGPGVWMGGNIGGSLLPVVEEIRGDDWVVLELSSFMLEGLREDKWSPHIAVVTNISPNHLDWHGSMENYVAAKRAIFEFQLDQDVLLSGTTSQDFPQRSIAVHDDVVPFSMKLPGKHNASNAWLAAYTVSRAIDGCVPRACVEELIDFRGLAHRLAYVGECNGIRFYNDSKATTPEASLLALQAFQGVAETHVILGGYDKGSDLSRLATEAADRCAGVYTIGQTGPQIAAAAIEGRGWDGKHLKSEEAKDSYWVREAQHGAVVTHCETLGVAVRQILNCAAEGQVALLSPGCASWDQFANYEERGVRFVELAKQHGIAP